MKNQVEGCPLDSQHTWTKVEGTSTPKGELGDWETRVQWACPCGAFKITTKVYHHRPV